MTNTYRPLYGGHILLAILFVLTLGACAGPIATTTTPTPVPPSDVPPPGLTSSATSLPGVVGLLPPPGGCGLVQGTWPNPRCTPGRVNPAVTDATARITVCVTGWSGEQIDRLFPLALSDQVFRRLMDAEGLTGPPSAYVLDHLFPVELGGAVNDLRDLWVLPWQGPHGAYAKDREATTLHARVCTGTLSVLGALQQMHADWSGPHA